MSRGHALSYKDQSNFLLYVYSKSMSISDSVIPKYRAEYNL